MEEAVTHEKIVQDKEFNLGDSQTYILTAISGLFLLFSWFGWFKDILGFDPAWVSIIISGTPILRGAIVGLFKHRDIKAGMLVSIALVAAVAVSEYFAAGEVAFIMMIGEILEERTVAKAKAGIKELLDVVPPMAQVRRNGHELRIRVEEVKIGDMVLVRPGEYIPVDGEVFSGQSSVSQAAVTGESMPVDKHPGDEVFVGSLNQLGVLEIKATKVGEDTTLAKVVKLVEEAENNKSPIVRTADRWATWMVPMALGMAVLVYLFTRDLIRAVTILIVFCPCALVLSTPTAIMAGIGNAARRGILVKSGEAMELSSKINALVFDKTGTLTKGMPVVTKIKCFQNNTEQDVLKLAAIAEKFSEHPLSQAIIKRASVEGLNIPDPESFEVLLGRGIKALYQGDDILVGNSRLLEQRSILMSCEVEHFVQMTEETGQTPIMIVSGKKLIGVIVISDPIKDSSTGLVKSLQDISISEVWMLTGDNDRSAKAIANKLKIPNYAAEQLPEQKVEVIKRLKEKGNIVAMVGDGINDAPSLALSDIGIAMGAVGTDIAIQTADIALMSDELNRIPQLVKLSRRVVSRINENIAISMLINLVAIILASIGMMGPIIGALVHNAGSVLVVANSGRLIKYKP